LANATDNNMLVVTTITF